MAESEQMGEATITPDKAVETGAVINSAAEQADGLQAIPSPHAPKESLLPQAPKAMPRPRKPVVLSPEQIASMEKARRRMKGFARHLLAYLGAVVFVLPFSVFYVKDEIHNHIGFLIMFGWLAGIAIHVNFAMKPILDRPNKEGKKKSTA